MAGCDRCSMCCKLLEIADDGYEKKANTWCKHCTKPGCGIYSARPKPCIDYQCVWLQSQSDSHPLPTSLRPDKCHAVVDITSDNLFAIVRVDPAHPKALADTKVKILVSTLAQIHTVIVIMGHKRTIISETPEGRKKLRELGFNDNEVTWNE
jgi:hypothetical protein